MSAAGADARRSRRPDGNRRCAPSGPPGFARGRAAAPREGSALASAPPAGRAPSPPSVGSAGFALPAVLWMLVLVGAVAATYLSAARSERRSVAHALESSRARWAARAAFARATAGLDEALRSADARRRFRAAGDTLLVRGDVEIDGVQASAALVDARSRLHVNRASTRRFGVLLEALGVPAPRARRLAARLADWRDPDDRPRREGAEAPAYAARHLPARPPDGPLASVHEIDGLLGMDAATAAAVRPHVTVVGDGRVNLNTASVPVLTTLPGLDAEAARALAVARGQAPVTGFQAAVDALPADAARSVRSRREAFEEQAAYGPRHAKLVARATTGAPGGRALVQAEVELEGGSSWRIVRTVER